MLLRAIDSIRQRRLQHLYSKEKKKGVGRKEMESCDRSKENERKKISKGRAGDDAGI